MADEKAKDAGAPEPEITPAMLRAGAEVIWRCFDDASHSSYGEHVAVLVFEAMDKCRDS